MISLQGFRYALYESRPTNAICRRFAGARRFVWNKGLALQLDCRSRGEPVPRYATMCKLLTTWKVDYPWLRDVHSQVLQQALKDLDRAWSKCFKDLASIKRGQLRCVEKAGAPSFRRRGEGDTFRYPQPKPEHVDAANGRAFLPMIGWVRFRNSRPAVGAIRQITLTQVGGRWMISLTMAGEQELACGDELIGIDRGITDTLALSNGQRIAPLNALKQSAYRLKRYQRSVSRKIEAQKRVMGLDPKAPFPKGVHPPKSARQRCAEAKVARCHRHIANQRRDWAHKLTTEIANDSCLVVLEDLKIKSMSASAAGTINAPGNRVAAKRGLNRSILEQCWGTLEQLLRYKLEWRNARLMKVPAPYTSQRCSACGYTNADNRNKKNFVCLLCSHTEDADVNAAKNILAAGLADLARKHQAGHADVEDTMLLNRPAKRQPANAEALCL